MTDIELTRLCAEAMGFLSENSVILEWPSGKPYDPIHDDAQAMMLVKKFKLSLDFEHGDWYAHTSDAEPIMSFNEHVNRAIVETVAKIQMQTKI